MTRAPAVRFLFIACLAFLAGCSTHADRLRQVRFSYYAGDLTRARTDIDRLLIKPRKEAEVLQLDRAMVDLVSGQPKEAERRLRAVRDRFDHLEQKDVGEAALSLVTDDNALAYAGEDYEKVLLLSFLALSNVMTGGGDAQAYALQISDRQQKIIQQSGGFEKHPELEHAQVALGPYLRAAIAEESRLDFDDVIRARTMVVSYQPDFRDGEVDLQRAQHEVPMQPGNGLLYIFTLVGRGPTKEETIEVPTQAALLIADRIVSAVGKHELPPTIAPIRVPKLVERSNRISSVQVSVDGKDAGDTTTIVDVGQVAMAHYEAKYPEIVGRAVARRVLKKAAAYAVKDNVSGGRPGPFADLALTLAGVAWEASEAPDTRCWGLLPDQIQVLRIELPAGEHVIGLSPADHNLAIGSQELATVNITDSRNTYLLANFPETRLVGEIVTSSAKSSSP